MRVLNKYHLELHWDKVEYIADDMISLKQAYFIGSVLKDTVKINCNDGLLLDMTYQHMIFIPEYYQVSLKWKEIQYQDDKIFLKQATIKGKHVNSIEPLNDDDFILIDCKEHDETKHAYNLVYWAEVCKQDKDKKY